MKGVILSVVIFIVVLELLDNMVTGTDTGSQIINALGPILAGLGVVWRLVKMGTGSG